jgi:ribosomal protein L9
VYAGFPLDAERQAMARKFQTVVARLAMAELARPVCACESANRELHNWQFDLARSAGSNDETFGFISREDLANPLGTRRGAVFAWKQIRNLRQTVGTTGF